MPTIAAPSIPVFSYVGRLRDSRKGLEVFLDALSLIWTHQPSPLFRAWVIGGSEDDHAAAVALAACRPALRRKLASGDLIFWGRVENDALPEFYSRSHALVVPSLREQFGIVAVEAMMCGCPVIAARVGGLQDIVLEGRTGTFFERGSPTALAGVMTTYAAMPALPRWLGTNSEAWGRHAFAAEPIYKELLMLLSDPREARCAAWLAEPESAFRAMMIKRHLPIVESILGSPIISFNDLTSGPSLSFMAQSNNEQRYFVKVYTERPTDISTLYGRDLAESPHTLPKERLLMTLSLRGQPFLPAVLGYDLEAGIIVQEWCEQQKLSHHDLLAAKLRAASQIRAFDPAPELMGQRQIIYQRLSEQGHITTEFLAEVDALNAILHAPLIGGIMRLRRLHPQLELFRLSKVLDRHVYWLPRDYVIRALALISFLLTAEPLLPALPTFGHGSFKKAHLLNSTQVCDFDHAAYFCGPKDIAHFVWESFEAIQRYNPAPMLRVLQQQVNDHTEWFLGACWILVLRLNKDLIRCLRGKPVVPGALISLYEFPEAMQASNYSVSRRRLPTASSVE